MPYKRADTDWLAACRFGVAVHWTAQSMPIRGPARSFQAAVDNFDVEAFVAAVAASGADYLLFTATHALQMIPAPCAAVEGLLPQRTSARDLLGELARACRHHKLHFLLYYNHSCNSGDDPAWEQAVGYHDSNKQLFADRLCAIVAELSQRYGTQLAAWWFDSSYSLDPSGPHNTVTTDLAGFLFPWNRLTAAAKLGHPERLVTYNPGMQPHEWCYLYTHHQDYLAGEANTLVSPPTSRLAANGLQNHRWICLDNPAWVHNQRDTPLYPARFGLDQLGSYFRTAAAASTPVTVNLDVDQNAQLHAGSLELLRQLSQAIAPHRTSTNSL